MSRLLLVDDNPSVHRVIESLLAPLGVALVALTDAAEALARVDRGEAFDLALVDAVMPGVDGWTLVERLRERPATAPLPILFMAGVLDEVDEARLAGAPVQGFLRKPTEFRELAERVRGLLAVQAPAAPAKAPVSDLLELDLETLQPSGGGAAPTPSETPAPEASDAFLRALRADPQRLDALARAVAARLHEPAMRELVRDLVLDLNLPKP